MEDATEFRWKKTYGNYEVYVAYSTQGPTQEEADALFREACHSTLYRNLAQLACQMPESEKAEEQREESV